MMHICAYGADGRYSCAHVRKRSNAAAAEPFFSPFTSPQEVQSRDLAAAIAASTVASTQVSTSTNAVAQAKTTVMASQAQIPT